MKPHTAVSAMQPYMVCLRTDLRKGEKGLKTRVQEMRKARKLSQEELADAVGVTRQTITSLERGKYMASLPLAYKLARYFGTSIEEIFLFEEEDL